ncbi:type I secretion system permease/ATPase [Bradyrhizobium valentinum]|uniref:ABC transporter ATP-binding protein n=1 Tax=Bradyrhizobium valentinum TaxID=1518501 RepID=A0A0R3KE49_9BRAD|nr:type I secretion system permease/ATPase [Bradyrhizobium valentinum]KRQ91716.1 ABC transporter ATP-binding protein [Bradyrhizobium valentinum]KRQ93162.1 ABC transporter ATP-binding protein [Bradyrhizobium valentinum]
MLMPPLQPQTMSPPRTPLNSALRACAGALGLVFAYSCSYNLLLLAPSIYLLQIYDRVLSSRSGATLLMLTIIVAFTVVVGGVLDALRRAALGRMGEWLEEELHPTALSACFKYAYADRARASEAYRDLAILRQLAQSGACSTLFDALWTPLFLGVLFLVHPFLGVIGVLSVLFLLGLGVAEDWLTEAPLVRSAGALTRSQGWFGMAVGNLHVIRAMGMLDGAARRIGQAAQDARSQQEVVQRRRETIMLISKPARALAQVLIMGTAAWLVLEQSRSPAIIFATTLLFGRALAPVEGAVAGWKAFAMALAAYRRLNDAMSAVTSVANVRRPLPERPNGGLIVDNVGVAVLGSDHWMLRDVSFSLAPGECLGIIGPSGSGKSTLGRIITGISAPTSGSVLLDGIDMLAPHDSDGGRRLGYLPQDIDLVGETVKDIIARLDDADLQKVIEAAKLAGLHETIIRLPHAYDTVVNGGGANLPRGFRQRLGLARAFFGDPHLVVLDEPNSSLDSLGERMLFDAIERMKAANTTVIIITHRIGILGATNKLAIMQGGAVSAFGDSREIFERCLARPQVASREPVS